MPAKVCSDVNDALRILGLTREDYAEALSNTISQPEASQETADFNEQLCRLANAVLRWSNRSLSVLLGAKCSDPVCLIRDGQIGIVVATLAAMESESGHA